ncbi:hypothetical protein MVEN_02525400 [Mycena venus]|uniref:Ketoreductase (KR) domain-containing protein n=1 Tax=Mycena venus TaxID=2733690 RepID=A0A8H6WUP6_9AGAR|nr:hypothetical protein MVEN_02525400 [Mycena venus]
MAEAFAHYTHGKAHIILIGRNADAAARWRHEFIVCDATSMGEIRATCLALRERLTRLNFLVVSAGFNSMSTSKETSEGLDYHLALRVASAARLMPVSRTTSGLDKARAGTIKALKGVMLSFAAVKGMTYSPGYNDALVAHFASRNPGIAFTHIHPGFVKTSGLHSDAGWLLAPISWLYELVMIFVAVRPELCAEYMLYALLDADRGVFLRSPTANVFSSHLFDVPVNLDTNSPTAHQAGVLHGVRLQGYSGSDVTVKAVIDFTENVTSATHLGR